MKLYSQYGNAFRVSIILTRVVTSSINSQGDFTTFRLMVVI